MEDYFDVPPEGATGQGGRTFKKPIRVSYKSGEVPAAYVEAAKAQLPAQVSDGMIGFSAWNGETKTRRPLQSFNFVVLETYAGVSGKNFESGVSFWSNRVKDTRTDNVTVYASNKFTMRGEKPHYEPIAGGIYATIKETLPFGARFALFIVAYLIELDEVVEIETTGTARAGIEKAMRDAGQKNTFLLGITDNDHLWGFSLRGFFGVNKEGKPWTGPDKMYWAPEMVCGILSPSKKPELHAKCVNLQEEERERHSYYKALNAAPANAATPPQQPAAESQPQGPISTTVVANHALPADDPIFSNPDDLPF